MLLGRTWQKYGRTVSDLGMGIQPQYRSAVINCTPLRADRRLPSAHLLFALSGRSRAPYASCERSACIAGPLARENERPSCQPTKARLSRVRDPALPRARSGGAGEL